MLFTHLLLSIWRSRCRRLPRSTLRWKEWTRSACATMRCCATALILDTRNRAVGPLPLCVWTLSSLSLLTCFPKWPTATRNCDDPILSATDRTPATAPWPYNCATGCRLCALPWWNWWQTKTNNNLIKTIIEIQIYSYLFKNCFRSIRK